MKSYSLVLLLGFVLTAFGPLACNRIERGVEAAGEPDEFVTTADRDFMRKAAEAHVMEINLARLAQEKATSEDVKDYAEMLEHDHFGALEDLRNLMTRYNVDVTLDANDHAHEKSLTRLQGAQFDRTFINLMVDNHRKGVSNYRARVNVTHNSELKEHISQMLPTLEKHFTEAKRVQTELTTINTTGL